MKTTVLLADAAQMDASGKAHALGLGWTVTTTPTPPAAVVALIEVDWHETNTRFNISIELEDEDGQPVMVPGPVGELVQLMAKAEFEAGRPPGLPQGTSLSVPFVVPVGGGIPLVAGKRYRWRVENSGQPGDDLGVSFYVRENPNPVPAI
jgi:hypothetical protein